MGVLGILKRNKITQGLGMLGFAREWAPLRVFVFFEDFA